MERDEGTGLAQVLLEDRAEVGPAELGDEVADQAEAGRLGGRQPLFEDRLDSRERRVARGGARAGAEPEDGPQADVPVVLQEGDERLGLLGDRQVSSRDPPASDCFRRLLNCTGGGALLGPWRV